MLEEPVLEEPALPPNCAPPLVLSPMPPIMYCHRTATVPQASGTAPFTDDTPIAQGALYAAWVLSDRAHAKVRACQHV